MNEQPRRTQADRSATTRRALVTAARTLFAEHGFADVGTERIAAAAGVTRGALYHQFADKTELFAAVVETVEGQIMVRLARLLGDVADADPSACCSPAPTPGWTPRWIRRSSASSSSTDPPCSAGSGGGRSACATGWGWCRRCSRKRWPTGRSPNSRSSRWPTPWSEPSTRPRCTSPAPDPAAPAAMGPIVHRLVHALTVSFSNRAWVRCSGVRAVVLEVDPQLLTDTLTPLGLDGRDEMWDGELHMVPPASGTHQRFGLSDLP